MTFLWAATALCVASTALFLVVAASARVESAGLRRRSRRLRARIEPSLYAFIAADGPAPPAPRKRAERRMFRTVAADLLLELEDPERARLAECLDSHGLVWDATRELRSRFPAKRRRAADELALVRSPRSAPALQRALGDPDESVRLQSARALAELGEPEYADELLRALEHTRPSGEAAAVLIALRERMPETLEELCWTTSSPDLRSIGLELLRP
jgi:HEAT repeats